ncbi:MAG: ATP-dependent Clp protease ATP-binding subunit [Bacteroidales bacterium]|nr:ATP-dependent Clp protease ATP-binding subunit [Bacteroidales bacterium]
MLDIARRYAEDNLNAEVAPAHLMRALLHPDMGMVDFIESVLDKDYYYFVEWADARIKLEDKASRPVSAEVSEAVTSVISEAEEYKTKIGKTDVDAICILASLVTPGVGFTYEELKSLPITVQEVLMAAGNTGLGISNRASESQIVVQSGLKAISKYCIDKLAQVRNSKDSKVVGFEREIGVIYESLGRKTKSNLLITGESGVGKTALIRGFAESLAGNNVPSKLAGSLLFELDLSALTAGASYKGEVEDRVKSLFGELKSLVSPILIIESIDKVFEKQDLLYGVASMLKRELGSGSFSLLCTCSTSGYTKNIETDKEFTRMLDRLALEQPDEEQCLRILEGSIENYETYHQLRIGREVLVEAIRLAKRYMAEKSLPDSAFDLIDRTMSQISTMNSVSANDIALLRSELEEKQGNNPEEIQEDLNWLHYKIFNKLSCLLTAQIDDDTDFLKLEDTEKKISYLNDVLTRLEKIAATKVDEVRSADLFAVVAKLTGIPLGKVQSKEREKLVSGEEVLKRRVIGQDHAIKVVLDAIYESRSGLNKKGQPMGSFFFLGPTGTGKTELSKSLVEFLFGDERSLIRFDMSEFKEEHSVALLYGAPPGYVGYEEGGLLVNKIRQNPYSVVLFDEIEKAHKSVFDLFLQILDEGKLHDRLGRVGDFSNSLILFTSNIGSQYIVDSFGKGIIPSNNDLMEIMQGHFRPEFLGRLTEIVPFAPITEQTVVRIFEIHLRNLMKQLEEQHISLDIDDETKRAVAMSGFNPQYGARPIIGIIRKMLRRPLSTLIIQGKVKSGDKVVATWKEDHVEFN